VPRVNRRSLADRERDAQAVALRARGLNHRQISAQLGWKSPSSAVDAIDRAMREHQREDLEKIRKIEEDKLDDLTRLVWRELGRTHFVVSPQQGKVITFFDPTSGEERPLTDPAPTYQGVDRLLKIAERRAKLRGLDAPIKAKVEVQDSLDADIERLVAELAGSQPGSEADAPRPADRRAREAPSG
jgi:hypothetical protein